MKTLISFLAGLNLALFFSFTSSLGATQLNVSIEIPKSQIKKGIKGQVICALFDTQSKKVFPKKGIKQYRYLRVPINSQQVKNNQVSCVFKDIKKGTYAISVLYDRNKNHKCDTNFLGYPVELWGVSNNARPKLRPPSFDEAKINIQKDQTIRVRVR